MSLLHRRHLHQVAHTLDHAAKRFGVLLHDDVLMMTQPEGIERGAHGFRMTDAAAYLLDEHPTIGRRAYRLRFLGASRPMPDECSRHERPPYPSRASDTGCSMPRHRAHEQSARASSIAAAH